MIISQIEKVDQKILELKCDRCGKITDEEAEIQDFHRINFTGGYGSIFGDMNKIEADICATCLHDLISSFARVTSFN